MPFTSDLEVGLQRYRQGGVLWLRPAGAGLRALGQPPGGASWPCLPSRPARAGLQRATPERDPWGPPRPGPRATPSKLGALRGAGKRLPHVPECKHSWPPPTCPHRPASGPAWPPSRSSFVSPFPAPQAGSGGGLRPHLAPRPPVAKAPGLRPWPKRLPYQAFCLDRPDCRLDRASRLSWSFVACPTAPAPGRPGP